MHTPRLRVTLALLLLVASTLDFGMARAYSQEGDFEKALEHTRIALARAPAGSQMQNLETQIARLEEGENINP